MESSVCCYTFALPDRKQKKSICNDKFSDALVATVSLDFIAHIVLLCTPRGNKMRGRKEEKLVFLKIYIGTLIFSKVQGHAQ